MTVIPISDISYSLGKELIDQLRKEKEFFVNDLIAFCLQPLVMIDKYSMGKEQEKVQFAVAKQNSRYK